MSGEALLVVVRAAHLLAAAVWVGGAIAYAVAGRPAPGTAARSFSWLVAVSTWALILTGMAITADRLSSTATGLPYVATLAVKIALGVAMFVLAGTVAPSALRRFRAELGEPVPTVDRPLWLTTPYVVMWLGIAVYVLGAALAVTYTRSLADR